MMKGEALWWLTPILGLLNHHQGVGGVGNCVACPKMIPICHCPPHQRCAITRQTCIQCAQALCITPLTKAPEEKVNHNYYNHSHTHNILFDRIENNP